MYLTKSADYSSVRSLLRWLAQPAVPVEELALMDVNAECQAAVLVALLSRPEKSRLTKIYEENLSPMAMNLMADFQSITTCHLRRTFGKRHDALPDLAPLQALPHLSELHLSGACNCPQQYCANVHLLSHVT